MSHVHTSKNHFRFIRPWTSYQARPALSVYSICRHRRKVPTMRQRCSRTRFVLTVPRPYPRSSAVVSSVTAEAARLRASGPPPATWSRACRCPFRFLPSPPVASLVRIDRTPFQFRDDHSRTPSSVSACYTSLKMVPPSGLETSMTLLKWLWRATLCVMTKTDSRVFSSSWRNCITRSTLAASRASNGSS